MKYCLFFTILAMTAFSAAVPTVPREANDAKLMADARNNNVFVEKRCGSAGTICYANEQCCPGLACAWGWEHGNCAHESKEE